MSNTPETDGAEIIFSPLEGDAWVPASISRKLERERDEALMDRASGDIATMTRNHYERILKERDEAIRQRNETNESSKYAVDYAIRERDEARELVYAWESRWKAEVEFACRVSIKCDELLDILRKLLEIIPEPECHDFGHTKEERHAFLEKCPVMERYDALIAQAKEAAK